MQVIEHIDARIAIDSDGRFTDTSIKEGFLPLLDIDPDMADYTTRNNRLTIKDINPDHFDDISSDNFVTETLTNEGYSMTYDETIETIIIEQV